MPFSSNVRRRTAAVRWLAATPNTEAGRTASQLDVETASGTALRASVLRRAVRSSKAALERGVDMETFEQTRTVTA